MSQKSTKSDSIYVERDAFQAVRNGDAVLLRELLDRGLSVNNCRWSGWSLLHRAAENGHTHVCEMLLDHGASINCRSVWGWHTPLHLALGNGFLDTAFLLFEHGADINIKNKYQDIPSAYSRRRGYLSVAKQFDSEVFRVSLLRTSTTATTRATTGSKSFSTRESTAATR
eukprot:gene2955-5800_t